MPDAVRTLSMCTILSAFAGACAGATSEPVAPAPVGYADAVQARAAEELAELPPPCPRDATSAGCSAVHRLVLDYERLRRRVRAIRNRRGD